MTTLTAPLYLPVAWEGKRAPLAVRVADACAHFEARTGQAPTAILVPPGTGYPPPGCGLRWRESSRVRAGELWPGIETEAQP